MGFFPRNLSTTFLLWAWAHGSVTALEQWNVREEEGFWVLENRLNTWMGSKPEVLQKMIPTLSTYCTCIFLFPMLLDPKAF